MFSAVRKLVSLQTKVFICLIKTFFFYFRGKFDCPFVINPAFLHAYLARFSIFCFRYCSLLNPGFGRNVIFDDMGKLRIHDPKISVGTLAIIYNLTA